MAFIKVEFAGGAKPGGYLKIDGGIINKLTQLTVFPISAGIHHFSFSSKSGNSRIAVGEITIEFDENNLICISVVTDLEGHILSLPSYSIQKLKEDEMQSMADIAESQRTKIKLKARLTAGIVLVLIALVLIFDGGGDMTNVIGGIGIGLVGVLFLVLAFYKKKKR